ncbi:MAG: MATE family efflux transporter [Pseudomonadota bacterium]
MTLLSQRARFFNESKALFVLGWPLIVNNVIIGLTTFIDFIMAGRLGTLDLGAVSVASTLWSFVFLAGMGVMMALNPIAAQLHGANRPTNIGEAGRQGLWLSLLIALIIFVAIRYASAPFMRLIGIEEPLIPLATGYLQALAFGSFAIFAFLGLRFISEGIGHTKPIMMVAIIGLITNATGNYVLMFGNFGAPRLGLVGCGVATAVSMWVSLLFMLTYMHLRKRVYAPLELFRHFDWPNGARIREFLRVGLPIGGSVTAEVGLFSAAGLIMGTLSATEAAAHAVAINYAATMFMVPLGLHSALMIRVGQNVGSGHVSDARYAGWVGICLCGAFMTVSALVLMVFRTPITSLYVDDPAVRAVAAQLLLLAMIFQITDGIQVGAAGAVRGFKDTTVPMYINIFAFWVVGFPIAWYAGTQLGFRGEGVWGGLAVGLTVAAILLCWRFHHISRSAQSAVHSPV